MCSNFSKACISVVINFAYSILLEISKFACICLHFPSVIRFWLSLFALWHTKCNMQHRAGCCTHSIFLWKFLLLSCFMHLLFRVERMLRLMLRLGLPKLFSPLFASFFMNYNFNSCAIVFGEMYFCCSWIFYLNIQYHLVHWLYSFLLYFLETQTHFYSTH